ncbi:uncharacterized protein LOC142639463 [Castanea sativa]|uniref:uncharacterized protein LOC142639463 n=1 Tax=Castanea sativa TaxID=21020 RepID=UPI003F64BFC4
MPYEKLTCERVTCRAHDWKLKSHARLEIFASVPWERSSREDFTCEDCQSGLTILKTTYEGTKKVKDTKLQMITTRFEEIKISDDESFDSFYRRLNKIVIVKLNLGEKTEDAKVVRKILRSLPESLRAKVIAIEESTELDEINI